MAVQQDKSDLTKGCNNQASLSYTQTMFSTPLGIFFFVLSLFALIISLLNHWFLSQGKLHISYPLIILACTCYIVIETMLAFRDPVQMGIMVFGVGNIWAITMACKGLKRLKKKRDEDVGR